MLEDLIKERINKLREYQKVVYPYPSQVRRDFTLGELARSFTPLARAGKELAVTGRIFGWRDQGKIIFADIRDGSGTVQLVLEEHASKKFDLIKQTIDLGDIVEVRGKAFTTKRRERSIAVKRIRLIAKSLRPWPSSWFGIEDIEERYRRRYLDFIYNTEMKDTLTIRSRIIALLRALLTEDGFMEVETPVLQPIPGGALAQPFKTHFNALDLDMYLRIAPELYLKRLLVGGFEKIFEIGKNFRNEGIDRDHYPEFTMLELYWAYQDYLGLMKATERWLKSLVKSLGIQRITVDKKIIKFRSRWQYCTFEDLIKKYSPRSVRKLHTYEIDDVFKKKVLPNLIDPVFVIDHPKKISPLSKPKEDNPEFVERFQLIVGGKELVNGFSELNDPIDQRERMQEQERMYRAGNREASRLDNDFLEAIEYGMPPAAGMGIGIDRLVALLTGTHAIRDTMTFSTLRPR